MTIFHYGILPCPFAPSIFLINIRLKMWGENGPQIQGLFSHAYERCIGFIHCLDDLGKVGEASGQSVDLVDDDDADLLGFNFCEQLLKRRPIHRSARIATIVVERVIK